MKFVNGTQAILRHYGDESHHPYGRNNKKPEPVIPKPAPQVVDPNVLAVLNAMKPDQKHILESKMLKASRVLPVSAIQKEAEDILTILRNLHKN